MLFRAFSIIVSRHLEAPDSKRRTLVNILITFGILTCTILLTETPFALYVGRQSVLLLYMLAVVLVSYLTTDYVYGVFSSLICTLSYDFLITEPRLGFSFTVGWPFTLITMLIVTFLTSAIANRLKVQARLALEREQRIKLMYEFNQRLLRARSIDAIIHLSTLYMQDYLQCPVIFYIKNPTVNGAEAYTESGGEDAKVFHTEREVARVHSIFAQNPESETAGNEPVILYIPIKSKGSVLGVIGIARKDQELSEHHLTFVNMFAGQVTMAVELQTLADEQNRILVEVEKEQMRGNMLRAISHDLRTPLTNILLTSNNLLDREIFFDSGMQISAIQDIRESTQWLIRMVENILIITRISGKKMKVAKSMEAVEEVVAKAVSIVRKRFPAHNIQIRVPDKLIMASMDAILIAQVLVNLLENAAKASPESQPILLEIMEEDASVRFIVSDNGHSIPESYLDDLFGSHAGNDANVSGGAPNRTGIGLSICHTIVKAHGGTISGCNKIEGGACFTVSLPQGE